MSALALIAFGITTLQVNDTNLPRPLQRITDCTPRVNYEELRRHSLPRTRPTVFPSSLVHHSIIHIYSSRSQRDRDCRGPVPASGHPGTHAKQTSGPLLHSHTTPSPVQTLILRNQAASICSPPCRSSIHQGLFWPPEVFARQMRSRSPTPSDVIRPRNQI